MLRRNRLLLIAFACSLCSVVADLPKDVRGAPRTGSSRGTATPQTSPAPTAPLQEGPAVQVLVTKGVQADGRVVYRYAVVNGSPFPVRRLLVGYDYLHGAEQLSGMARESDGRTAPAVDHQSPLGWNFRAIRAKGDSVGHLQWDSDGEAAEILGGSILAGFEITPTKPDEPYENGFWTVYLNSGEEPILSAGLQPTTARVVPAPGTFASTDLRVERNPTRGGVEIQFGSPVAAISSAQIYDVLGQPVRRIRGTPGGPGVAVVEWDGRDDSGHEVDAGPYFARSTAGSRERLVRFDWPSGAMGGSSAQVHPFAIGHEGGTVVHHLGDPPTARHTLDPKKSVELTVRSTGVSGDTVRYSYVLRNHTGADLNNFMLGLTLFPDSASPELNELPVGWTEDERCPPSIAIRKPWAGCVTFQEEAPGLFLDFDYPNAGAFTGVAPGDSLEFSVTVPKPDATYERAVFWIVSYPREYTGRAGAE